MLSLGLSVFDWLFAGTAQVISHHAFLLVIVSSCLNRFGKEWSITSFYRASDKSSLCHLQYRTCWKPTVVSQLQQGSEVHKPSIFSNISGSGLIRHDWSLNHLQEEPFHRIAFCFFARLNPPTNNTHGSRKTPESLTSTSRAAYVVLGKKRCISVQSSSLAHTFISGYSPDERHIEL